MREMYSYSREATVAAFKDYYDFLRRMYMDEASVVEPSEGGWPAITTENMQSLGKSDEVIALLRELPYIRPNSIHASAKCTWADWDAAARALQCGKRTAESIRMNSEESPEDVPAQVFGITDGGRENDVFYLDTREGSIYWIDCPSDIREDPEAVCQQSSPWIDNEDISEGQDDWRNSHSTGVWTIPDFFEIMKDELRRLKCIPMNEREVELADTWPPATELARRTFHEHGWPDQDQYKKAECIEALKRGLESEET